MKCYKNTEVVEKVGFVPENRALQLVTPENPNQMTFRITVFKRKQAGDMSSD